MTRTLPRTFLKASVSIRMASTESTQKVFDKKVGNIKMTLLQPNNESHRAEFGRILTNERIVFTSSWMDKWFGIKKIKSYTDRFAIKVDLVRSGDPDVSLSQTVMQQLDLGLSVTQVGLNSFFSLKENEKKLQEIYQGITSEAQTIGLGYFKFENELDILIGGGALAPIGKFEKDRKVDFAMHILDQGKGYGNACMHILLKEAFEKKDAQEVVGSSTLDHTITPGLCAQFGMIIKDDPKRNIKVYFMSKNMWTAAQEAASTLEKHPIEVAATQYGR